MNTAKEYTQPVHSVHYQYRNPYLAKCMQKYRLFLFDVFILLKSALVCPACAFNTHLSSAGSLSFLSATSPLYLPYQMLYSFAPSRWYLFGSTKSYWMIKTQKEERRKSFIKMMILILLFKHGRRTFCFIAGRDRYAAFSALYRVAASEPACPLPNQPVARGAGPISVGLSHCVSPVVLLW